MEISKETKSIIINALKDIGESVADGIYIVESYGFHILIII